MKLIQGVRTALNHQFETQPMTQHHGFGGQLFSQTHPVIRPVSRDTATITVIPAGGTRPNQTEQNVKP